MDNYLKAILSLGGPEERRVTIKSLAERLGVAPASVTNMLQKLAAAAAPLVVYERHRGVLLSAAGKRRALEVGTRRTGHTALGIAAMIAHIPVTLTTCRWRPPMFAHLRVVLAWARVRQ